MLLACIESMFHLATWCILFGTTIAETQLCSTEVPNGIVTSTCSREHGSVCNFTCDTGYTPAADVKSVTCGSDGSWTFTSTACIEKGPGLIITTSEPNSITKHIYTLPITQDGTPSLEYNRSYRFPKDAFFISVAGDYTLLHAYMYDYYTHAIYRDMNFSIDLSGDHALELFHRGLSSAYVNLAVDMISHNIYWTDPQYKWIVVKSLLGNDTSMYLVLIHENLEGPRALALDPIEGLLFWSDIGALTKIEVSSLSGRNRKPLITSKLVYPYSMAADCGTRRLYFFDYIRPSIETVTYEGKDRKILLRRYDENIFAMAVYKECLYMTSLYKRGLYVVNKTNGNMLYTSLYRDEAYLGLSVFHPDSQSISSTEQCMDHSCEHICVTDKDGATCLCKDGYTLNQDTRTCSLKNEYFHRGLMFSNDSSICIVDIRVVTDFVFDPMCVVNLNGIKHMIMDTDQRRMILATETSIYWAFVDDPELHLLSEACGIIRGLAWDGYDRNVYWIEENTGNIWRFSTEAERPQIFLLGLDKPRDIIILSHERLVFWISGTNGSKIESSNIHGNNRKDVLDSEQLVDPRSLSYDLYTKRIYFLDTYATDRSYVISCKLDGSKFEKIFSTDESLEKLDVYRGFVLVTAKHANGTLIISYSIDTAAETSGVFPGTGHISSIQVFDENIRQNETGPCISLNGECEDICISNGKSRICDCRFGFRLTDNGKTCTSDPFKDNFMLVIDSTDKTVYQISLMDQSVQGINIKSTQSPYGITYSPVDDVLIWGAKSELSIMHLNGTVKTVFPVLLSDNDYLTPNQVAVDHSTGNIYYTAANAMSFFGRNKSYISVLSPNGKERTLVIGLSDPSGLVIYPSKGLLFYTEEMYTPILGRANMDGSQSSILLNLTFEYPTDLTIDYKSDNLYYIDRSTQSVKYCMVDGTNHRTLIQYHQTVIRDIFFYQDHLFISTTAHSSIIKLNMSNPNVTTKFADQGELGNINYISIYSSKDQNKNAFCSVGNGGCSTFCFPIPGGGICGCENGIELTEGSDKVCSNMPSEHDSDVHRGVIATH